MPRFPIKTLLALGLCALAAGAFAAPRTLYPLLSDTRRPPSFTLPDTQGPPVRLDTFLRHVQQHRAEFDSRDLVVLALVPPQSALSKPLDTPPIHMLQDAQAATAHAYGGSSGTPAFYLIGKDGGIKMARRTFPSLRELFAAIDAMPMRREEMRRQSR